MKQNKWIIVSNRLPFTYDKNKKKIVKSSGGLVTALTGIQNNQTKVWVGTVPDDIPKDILEDFLEKDNYEFTFHPVFIPKKTYDLYYNKYCNEVLWPLFHYESNLVNYSEEAYESYKEVNSLFSLEILKIASANDTIWINDFHLFLVPDQLKKISPKLKIGHFLHIPFPSSEVFKQLPNREEILTGLLGSDLIGFHDSSYLRHFSSSVQHLLGYETDLLHVNKEDAKVRMGVFPVSIDTENFKRSSKSKIVLKKIKDIFESDKDKKIILSVDRLDYSKGLILKLKAYQNLLRNNPNLAEKLEMIIVAIPSRTDVKEYQMLKKEVELLISEINGEFSSLNYNPIRYLFRSVKKEELLALYRRADILFVTSKRDGMNLVALEYICCQDEANPGSVVISEFTGAASILSRAITINPWNIAGTASALSLALGKSLEERVKDHQEMLTFLESYDATKWAENFINKLKTHKNLSTSWKEEVKEFFTNYQMRIPQSSIEENFDSVLWHYPREIIPFVNTQVRKLVCELEEGLHHFSVEVSNYTGTVEVKIKEEFSPVVYKSALEEKKERPRPEIHPALSQTFPTLKIN